MLIDARNLMPWPIHACMQAGAIANSFLIEYCNNKPVFGYTNALPGPTALTLQTGGFLSQLDSQQLLTEE